MEHYDWNDGWLFTPVFDPAIVRPECPELTLEPVRLPHTVKTLPYNYCNENDYQKLSGYRREFFAPKEWEGRTVLLTFGAVAHDATVFCNGRRVFHHSCGYTAFTVDLTSALHLGQKNVVAVRCDSREDLNIPPFGGQMDFLTYGGICRAVCLDVKETAYLRDIFIETKAEGDFRIYTATVGETVGCTLQAEIRSPSGSRAFYTGELSLPITGALNSVHPWSIEHPTLYTLTVRLIRPGTGGLPDRVLDEKSCRFGFRTLQFVAGGLYLNGQPVETERFTYVMLHKPAGVLSATEDSRQQTVLDLLPPELRRRSLSPVGRLDKDTEGLLLLTNDGLLAHRLLAPRSHVDKVYYARVEGALEPADAAAFAAGMTLGDGLECLPAGLEILSPGECLVTLREGKFHQVKRMLAARGKPVTYLKRLSMGPLRLDPELAPGAFRMLTAEEKKALADCR